MTCPGKRGCSPGLFASRRLLICPRKFVIFWHNAALHRLARDDTIRTRCLPETGKAVKFSRKGISMKNFKRLLAFVLAGVLALTMLTACGSAVEDPTEKLVKVKCTEYTKEALKETGATVTDDEELQQITAAVVQKSWKKDQVGVGSDTTKDGKTVIVTWTGNTFANQDLPALTAAKDKIIANIKDTENGYYNLNAVHAEKAYVYTAVRDGKVLVAFALQFPKTSK